MNYCKRGHEKSEVNIIRHSDGTIKDCKLCNRIRAREWYANNKDKSNAYSRDAYARNPQKYLDRCRERELKNKYGITLEEYDNLFILQNNLCANQKCNTPIDKSNSHLDHCHKTNKLRGILCKKCNWALGLLRDDTAVIFGLIKYLETFNE